MNISEAEFISIVQAAADFDDYFSGRYFLVKWSSRSINEAVPAEIESVVRFLWRSRSIRGRAHNNGDAGSFARLAVSSTDNSLCLLEPSVLPRWAVELRDMLNALAESEFGAGTRSPLRKLCACGARYGLQKLEATIASGLLAYLSRKGKHHFTSELERTLARATRPCFTLELNAFRMATEALCFQQTAPLPKLVELKLLGTKPCDRLFRMFKRFPCLARLWSELICQWCDQLAEFLVRFGADRRALSRTFFGGRLIDKIVDVRSGLSDPHSKGRTVMLLQFEPGSLIYKPRAGDGEWEWRKLLGWINSGSFQPRLKAAQVLRRNEYCWMDYVPPAPCSDQKAACRFYRRLGGMIAIAHLLRAVDCHRANVIASGEYPVLIDAEALWHVARKTDAQNALASLSRTGFLSDSNRWSSLGYRSSVLGKTAWGQHIPRIGAEPLGSARYERELVAGFRRAWRHILGARERRVGFIRRLRRLRRQKARWIHWPTANYDCIRRASIQPAVLKSGIKRDILITRLCRRSGVSSRVIEREIRALRQFDIPYFTHKATALAMVGETAPLEELVAALRQGLHF